MSAFTVKYFENLALKVDNVLAALVSKDNKLRDLITTFMGNSPAAVSATGANIILFLKRASAGISNYDIMGKTNDTANEQVETVSIIDTDGLVFVDGYASNFTIGGAIINAGRWLINLYVKGNTLIENNISIEFYKRTALGVETLLFNESIVFTLNATNEIKLVTIDSLQGEFTCALDDILVIKIYFQTTSLTSVNLSLIHSGISHKSHIVTPFVNIPNRSFDVATDQERDDLVTTPKAVFDFVSAVITSINTSIAGAIVTANQYSDQLHQNSFFIQNSFNAFLLITDDSTDSYFDEFGNTIFPALVDSYVYLKDVPPYNWDLEHIYLQLEWDTESTSESNGAFFSISARTKNDGTAKAFAYGTPTTLVDTITQPTKNHVSNLTDNIIPSGPKTKGCSITFKITRMGTTDMPLDISMKNIRVFYQCTNSPLIPV